MATVVLALLMPLSVVGVEGMHSLLWGRDLLEGRLESFADGPVPRPLMIGVGAVASILGEGGGHTFFSALLGPLAYGVLVAATFDVAWQLGSAWAAALAVSVLVTSPVVLEWGTLSRHEVVYAALIVTALALELHRPRRCIPSLVLLALAGMVHPQAWLYTAGYLVWVGRAARPRVRFIRAAIALSAPAIWLAMDLAVTGDPLWSLRGEGGDFLSSLREGGRNLVSAAGPLVIVIAAAAYPRAMRARLEGIALLLNMIGLGVFGFIAWRAGLGLERDPALPTLTCLLAVLAAVVASGARFAPPVLAAIAAFALVFQAAVRLDAPIDVRAKTRAFEDHVEEARALVDRPRARAALDGCPRAAAPSEAVLAVFAYFSGGESSRWHVDRLGGAADLFAAPAAPAVTATFVGERDGVPDRFRIPRGLRPIDRTPGWRLYARACARSSLE